MWKWDKNLRYIQANEGMIKKETYKEISNEKFYSPEFRESLHDSRIVKIEINNGEIKDFISGNGADKTLTITLIGAYYDLYHVISYRNVRNYSITGSFDDADLIEHYFSIGGDFLVHTMIFQFGSISVFFESIKIETAKA